MGLENRALEAMGVRVGCREEAQYVENIKKFGLDHKKKQGCHMVQSLSEGSWQLLGGIGRKGRETRAGS